MGIIGRFSLYPGELLRLDLGSRIGLRCGRGRLWVTAGREGRDHELHDGQRLDCPGGLVLVEGEGELLVERAREHPWLPGRERIELFAAPSPSPPHFRSPPCLTSISATRTTRPGPCAPGCS